MLDVDPGDPAATGVAGVTAGVEAVGRTEGIPDGTAPETGTFGEGPRVTLSGGITEAGAPPGPKVMRGGFEDGAAGLALAVDPVGTTPVVGGTADGVGVTGEEGAVEPAASGSAIFGAAGDGTWVEPLGDGGFIVIEPASRGGAGLAGATSGLLDDDGVAGLAGERVT